MSNNSDIQNSLFETMKIFSESAASNSDSTITIEGKITDILDEASGSYQVEYLGSTFSAHSNSNVTYSIDDMVYILVPNGDFSKEKIIFGLVSASSTIYTNSSAVDKSSGSYYQISDNLINNTINSDPIKLSSYANDTPDSAFARNIVTDTSKLKTLNEVMTGYLDNYRTFELSMSIKTELAEAQQKSGNYGVRLRIPLLDTDGTSFYYSIDFDTTLFLGTYYDFKTWTPQSVYFTIDEKYQYDQSKYPTYSWFSYGFPTQDSEKASSVFDIFLKDICLRVVESMPSSDDDGYSLTIKANQGEYFASDYYSDSKTLTPTLKVNGKVASLSGSGTLIYWFKEDVSIKNDSEYYSTYGGYGWKCINERTNVTYQEDGTTTFDYITTLPSVTISRSEVEIATRFKCVIIYNEKNISATITLRDISDNDSIQLISTKNLTEVDGVTTIRSEIDNTYKKDVGYVELSAILQCSGITDDADNVSKISYSWARYDENNDYINDDSDFFEKVGDTYQTTINDEECFITNIRFPVNKVSNTNTVYGTARYTYVDFYKERQEEVVGTASVAITTTTLYALNLSIDNDNVIYKYDTYGYSPMSNNYSGPYASRVLSIAPLSYTLTDSKGEELTESEYAQVKYRWKMPKETVGMFALDSTVEPSSEDDNYYYYEGYGKSELYYDINDKFSMNKVKEPINLTISFGDTTLSESAGVSFIKEGEQGTNGTAYSAILVAGGNSSGNSVAYGTKNADGISQKLRFVYNNKTGNLFRYDYTHSNCNNLVLVGNLESNTIDKAIYTKAWKDNELLSSDSYQVTYEMFDSSVTSPCFDIDENGKLTLSITPSEDNCNIVQATISINEKDEDPAKNTALLYAYYPIELTIINLDIDDSEGISGIYVPSLDGGFSEVMYSSEGLDPQYDESEDFVLNDNVVLSAGLVSDGYLGIHWDSANHLGIYEQDNSAKKVSSDDVTTVTIRPDTKYLDGNSKNYIKVTIGFDNDLEETLTAQRNTYDQKYTEAKAEWKDEAENSEMFKKAIRGSDTELNPTTGYNAHVKTWYSSLDDLDELFTAKTESIYYLNLLQEETIPNLQNYISAIEEAHGGVFNVFMTPWDVLADLKSDLYILNEDIDSAESKITALDGKNVTTSDLVSLEDRKYEPDDMTKTYWLQLLGEEKTKIIEAYVDEMNRRIDLYQEVYNRFVLGDALTSYFQSYYEIKENLLEVAEMLNPSDAEFNVFAKYQNASSILESIVDSFDKSSTRSQIEGLLKYAEETLVALHTTPDADHELKIDEYFFTGLATDMAAIEARRDGYKLQRDAIDGILSLKQYNAVHIRPVVLYFNRYSLRNFNAWDGNKIEINEDDGYIVAPQIGAGQKEDDNSFTGVVMGVRQRTGYSSDVGLFGYSKGIQSFKLDSSNGAAIFGMAKIPTAPGEQPLQGGQIIIDPTKGALLYNSGYFTRYKDNGLPNSYYDTNKSGSGMCIDLANSTIHMADANGKLYSGSHNKIGSNQDGVYLSHDGLSITSSTGGHFELDTAEDVKLWSGSHNSLRSGETGFYLGSDGLSICGTYEYEDEEGNTQTANSAITMSTSGEPTLYSGKHNSFKSTKDGFYLSSGGLSIGNNFSVNSSGKLTAVDGDFTGKITATEGVIGGCEIAEGTLKINSANIETVNIENALLNGSSITPSTITAITDLSWNNTWRDLGKVITSINSVSAPSFSLDTTTADGFLTKAELKVTGDYAVNYSWANLGTVIQQLALTITKSTFTVLTAKEEASSSLENTNENAEKTTGE